MIIEKTKDLLTTEAEIIAHQTNCVGIMGGGVAKQIKEKLLDDAAFKKYQEYCFAEREALLGRIQYLNANNGKIIANLFAEVEPTDDEVDTNYEALRQCLTDLKFMAKRHGFKIAIPGYIGCGLAGGDWTVVYEIIRSVFENSPVVLEICYFPEAVCNLPEGYKWNHYEDGSGSITGPDGKRYFAYDCQPYGNAAGIEYQMTDTSAWSVFWDGFSAFKKFAEETLRSMERNTLKESIIADYEKESVEFSTGYLDIPANGMSILDAVELYEELQYSLNGDYVYFIKKLENDTISIGQICDFTKIFSVKDKGPEGCTITELLQLAEKKAKEAEGELMRFDWVDTDGFKEDGSVIVNGEILDFLF